MAKKMIREILECNGKVKKEITDKNEMMLAYRLMTSNESVALKEVKGDKFTINGYVIYTGQVIDDETGEELSNGTYMTLETSLGLIGTNSKSAVPGMQEIFKTFTFEGIQGVEFKVTSGTTKNGEFLGIEFAE